LIYYIALKAIKKSNPEIKRLPLYKKYQEEHKKYHDNEKRFTDISTEIYKITKIEWSAAIAFKDNSTIEMLINYITQYQSPLTTEHTQLILKIKKNILTTIKNYKTRILIIF
jgi:hypothetical protein